jgi:FkbM family methyltransferase
MGYPRWTMALVPYARRELPGWGMVLHACGVLANSSRWDDAPARSIRGKLHGYTMNLRLSDWAERHTYFLGRYYELGTQRCIERMVRPGDCFVDVGANIGMITLVAAHCVGDSGHVHAVEPNPANVDRIRAALAANRIGHVTIHPVGLSNEPGRLRLNLFPGAHTGTGTFTTVPESEAKVTQIEVAVLRGDDLALEPVAAPVFIKMDVEGYECLALDGFEAFITSRRPAVVTECVKWHLERAGHDLDQLFARMRGHGYEGYVVQMRRARWRQLLDLQPLGARSGDDFFRQYRTADVLWVHPDSPHQQRLQG